MALTKLHILPLHTDGRDPDLYSIARQDTNAVVGQYEGFLGRAKVFAERMELELLREGRG